ncbi:MULTISPECIES: LacI family DNA-binding transcriptional regulator [unclassified Modicisalibacter]|uniref:LacI family DNA-binding transcriptional regulator n=1 Tax=unclassified Modicisalibacter TaxID=2679913 RepID=UPI001CCC048F|nr:MULTISPECIES: LacI family DNA-binding transcriptional regulator [unclassified Modicisalibacter]MBZ9558764.1 LacI family DNA-binding transcriptional regulator [Modicisalibacter sp. R2A 31.J]MBZ9575345.1 LacI family DNA-binding transcriptional regulator [Modicisalibacter sp. MOD 31.J]
MSNQSSSDRRRRRGTDKPTLADVAREAGVSSITVSRVVNAPDSVRESTRKRVEDAIERVGYVRNMLAGSLASADSRFIAVIVPSLSNIVFNEVIYGLQTTFEKHGYQILLGNTDYSMQREYELVRTFMGWSSSALVTTGLRHTPPCLELLKGYRKPVMEIMELGQGVDLNVGLSHYDAGRCMAQHLLDRGNRHIIYAGTQMQGNYRARLRFEGQRELLERQGLPALMVEWDQPSSLELGREALHHVMQAHPDIQAIQFADDMMASGAILHATRTGIRVPDDIAICGFSGLPIGQHISPILTTIFSPREEMGVIAARNIIDRIEGKNPVAVTHDVGFSLSIGEST